MVKGSVMGKDPAVLWYWNDWSGGTCTFSRHIKGCYMDLLCAQFNCGPMSEDEIRTVLGADYDSAWPTLQKKFKQDENGLYFNSRLMDELVKRKEFSNSRRNSLKIDNGDMVYIYLLYDSESNTYKIGSSKYPDLRLSEVKKYKPEAEMFWKSLSKVPRSTEKDLHTEFVSKGKRANRDWFNLDTDDLNDITNRKIFVTRTGNENENEIEVLIDKVLEYLNIGAQTNFQLSAEGHRKHVRARINENHTLQDFMDVIDYRIKTWGQDHKMKEYLRPMTLFSNKFDGYLQAAKHSPVKPKSKVDAILESLHNSDIEIDHKHNKSA